MTNRKKSTLFLASCFLLCFVLSFIIPFGKLLKSQIFVNQQVKEYKETYYENVTITENAGQYNFYGNGSLMFTSENTINSEEYVHYVMLQHSQPKSILLVSGGISGMLKEILKYPSVENIDYIEPNQQMVALASKFINIPDDKRIHFIGGDARRYIRYTKEKYDIAILAIPDPSSLQIYRLYTVEFLHLLKTRLNPGAFILYGISPTGNYLSKEKTIFESSLYHSLQSVFANVKLVPGEKDYQIASDSTISIRIGEMSKHLNFENQYVNSSYMDDNSIVERSNLIETEIKDYNVINSDKKPVVVFAYTLQFLSQFGSKKLTLLIVPVLFFLIPLFFMRNSLRGMYLTGMTASSIEIMLIFIFQIIFGYVYAAIGIIIAIFMGGLAIGSLLSRRFNLTAYIRTISQILLALYILLIPLFWFFMNKSGNSLSLLLFFILNLIPGVLVGFLYGIYSRSMLKTNIQAPILVYAADLLGSALGVVAVTIIIFPLAGLANTCYILAGMNILVAIINWRKTWILSNNYP